MSASGVMHKIVVRAAATAFDATGWEKQASGVKLHTIAPTFQTFSDAQASVPPPLCPKTLSHGENKMV